MLNEEKHDKYDGKAIFVIGPPASGKSTFVKKAIDNLNFKLMDSDTIFERNMSKHNLSLKIDSLSPKDKNKKNELLDNAYDLNHKKVNMLIKNRKPVIIVRTGRLADSILRTKDLMDKYNYDYFLVLINVDENEAQKRNKERYRTVDQGFFKQSHVGFIRNKELLKKNFPNHLEITTSSGLTNEEFLKYGNIIQRWADKK
jgi:predicted kinase